MTQEPRRIVIYTRVSGKKQTVEMQLRECQDYANQIKNPDDIIITFSEPDKSTMLPLSRRKKLLETLDILRPDDILVIYKLDRLARHTKELVNLYFTIVEDLKVKIHSINDRDVDQTKIGIYAFIAHQERENIQKRTKAGLNNKKLNGERVGSVAYGYKLDETRLQTR